MNNLPSYLIPIATQDSHSNARFPKQRKIPITTRDPHGNERSVSKQDVVVTLEISLNGPRLSLNSANPGKLTNHNPRTQVTPLPYPTLATWPVKQDVTAWQVRVMTNRLSLNSMKTFRKNSIATRIHSSRMRTFAAVAVVREGGIYLEGVCLRRCLPRGGVCPGEVGVCRGEVLPGGVSA